MGPKRKRYNNVRWFFARLLVFSLQFSTECCHVCFLNHCCCSLPIQNFVLQKGVGLTFSARRRSNECSSPSPPIPWRLQVGLSRLQSTRGSVGNVDFWTFYISNTIYACFSVAYAYFGSSQSPKVNKMENTRNQTLWLYCGVECTRANVSSKK